jgi:hypothetical protein
MNCTNSCLERNAIGPGPRETIESRYLCDRDVFFCCGRVCVRAGATLAGTVQSAPQARRLQLDYEAGSKRHMKAPECLNNRAQGTRLGPKSLSGFRALQYTA